MKETDIYTREGKAALIKKHSPKSRALRNALRAFLFGGAICAVGEGLMLAFLALGADNRDAPLYVSLFMVSVAALLTFFGVFDRIARRAGAGTLVPITGFSNAVTSQAIDAKSEGLVLGVGSKIFTVSGPVILFGIFAGVLYGVIYYITNLIIKML